MSYIPQQVNRLQRDIRELEYEIQRANKRGNTVKAENLTWKKGYMMEMLSDLKWELTA